MLKMGDFGPLFLVRFPYNLGKMRVFKVLDDKSIVNAENG